jgi:hypothetical protein
VQRHRRRRRRRQVPTRPLPTEQGQAHRVLSISKMPYLRVGNAATALTVMWSGGPRSASW